MWRYFGNYLNEDQYLKQSPGALRVQAQVLNAFIAKIQTGKIDLPNNFLDELQDHLDQSVTYYKVVQRDAPLISELQLNNDQMLTRIFELEQQINEGIQERNTLLEEIERLTDMQKLRELSQEIERLNTIIATSHAMVDNERPARPRRD